MPDEPQKPFGKFHSANSDLSREELDAKMRAAIDNVEFHKPSSDPIPGMPQAIFCSEDTAKKIRRAEELAKQADPWPVICPQCGGENSHQMIDRQSVEEMSCEEDLRAAAIVKEPVRFRIVDGAMEIRCAACDGRGTIIQ